MGRSAIGMCLLALGLAAGTASAQQAPSERQTRDANLSAYVELLRSDVRSQKVAFLTELMGLSDAEDLVFWPIYREYDAELSALQDQKVAGIREYVTHYGSMTDDLASSLADRVFDLEAKRTALKQKYHARMKAALSPRVAARFLQIENQLLMIVDLQIASALPVVP